jgi:hypothetical protein
LKPKIEVPKVVHSDRFFATHGTLANESKMQKLLKFNFLMKINNTTSSISSKFKEFNKKTPSKKSPTDSAKPFLSACEEMNCSSRYTEELLEPLIRERTVQVVQFTNRIGGQ